MEAGNGTAGNGNKQDREQVLPIHVESGESFQVTGRIGYEHTDNGTHDHEDQQVAVQVISWLEQCPYRRYTGHKNIGKNNDMPGGSCQVNRAVQADGNSRYQHQDGNGGVHPFIQTGMF